MNDFLKYHAELAVVMVLGIILLIIAILLVQWAGSVVHPQVVGPR